MILRTKGVVLLCGGRAARQHSVSSRLATKYHTPRPAHLQTVSLSPLTSSNSSPFHSFTFLPKQDLPLCNRRTFFTTPQQRVGAADGTIGVEELVGLVRTALKHPTEHKYVLIDVREAEELADPTLGPIETALNIPLGQLEQVLCNSPEEFEEMYGVPRRRLEEVPVIFSCRSGVRAGSAVEIAKRLGIHNALNFKPSALGWHERMKKEPL